MTKQNNQKGLGIAWALMSMAILALFATPFFFFWKEPQVLLDFIIEFLGVEPLTMTGIFLVSMLVLVAVVAVSTANTLITLVMAVITGVGMSPHIIAAGGGWILGLLVISGAVPITLGVILKNFPKIAWLEIGFKGFNPQGRPFEGGAKLLSTGQDAPNFAAITRATAGLVKELMSAQPSEVPALAARHPDLLDALAGDDGVWEVVTQRIPTDNQRALASFVGRPEPTTRVQRRRR